MSPTAQPRPVAAQPHPARVTPRTLLIHLVTAALVAASLVLATATAGHAAPGHHRPATWNMQGAFSSSDSKWTTTVARLSAGGYNYLPHDVVALQEAGPRGSLPGTAVRSGTVAVSGRQATYQYEVRRWRIGSGSRGRDVYITWMNSDPTGNRNNVALVTHEQPRNVTAVAARQADNRHWGMRPALGVQLSDGSWFWSFHASSNGDNRSNDAENMMYQIASRGGQWAVLGDFNRNPVNLANLPAGSQIYSSGQGTQQSGGELDYMVSNDQQNMQGWTGRRLNGAGSDHYAVEFTFAAASSEYKIQYGKDPRKCINARYDDTVDVQGICDDQGTEEFSFSGQFSSHGTFTDLQPSLTRGPYCLDVRGEGTSNGTQVLWYSCGLGRNQIFRRTDDSALLADQSGKCVEVGGNEKLIINECTPAKPEQEWIVRSVSPYVYGFLSRFGPATGQEDAQTAGSGASSDPNGLNPSRPPVHDETKRSVPDGTASTSDGIPQMPTPPALTSPSTPSGSTGTTSGSSGTGDCLGSTGFVPCSGTPSTPGGSSGTTLNTPGGSSGTGSTSGGGSEPCRTPSGAPCPW